MEAWGFKYKTNIVWDKLRKDGGPDGRGVGFYFRNVTELVLFGMRGKNARTLEPGRSQVNILAHPQARAQPQARRAVQADRGLQLGPPPRTIQPRHPPRLDRLGQPGRRQLQARLAHLQLQQRPGDRSGVMFDRLREARFQIEFASHAKAILGTGFPDVVRDLKRRFRKFGCRSPRLLEAAAVRRSLHSD